VEDILSASGSLTEISGSPLEVPGTYIASVWDNFKLMLHTIFYRETVDDYLIIRPNGPIFLAGITALAVIGVALMVPKARQRWPSFLLIWFFVQAAFSPVVLAMPIVRYAAPHCSFLFAGVGCSWLCGLSEEDLPVPRWSGRCCASGALALTGRSYTSPRRRTFEVVSGRRFQT
jgi:hypothetical protein